MSSQILESAIRLTTFARKDLFGDAWLRCSRHDGEQKSSVLDAFRTMTESSGRDL